MSNPVNSGGSAGQPANGSIWITGTGAGANGGSWQVPTTINIPVTSVSPYPPASFNGDLSGAVPVTLVAKKISKDGCICKKCKELYPFAEPNQDDGTLICYGCRVVW